jgi:hypothetical protein
MAGKVLERPLAVIETDQQAHRHAQGLGVSRTDQNTVQLFNLCLNFRAVGRGILAGQFVHAISSLVAGCVGGALLYRNLAQANFSTGRSRQKNTKAPERLAPSILRFVLRCHCVRGTG